MEPPNNNGNTGNSSGIETVLKRRRILLFGAMVSVLACVVFLPALENGFVTWDDDRFVYDNPGLTSIGAGALKWAFTSVVLSSWYPLTLLSFSLDYTLWGLNPFGYHLTNVCLHALNAFLVFFLSLKIIRLGYAGGGAAPIPPGPAGPANWGLPAALITAVLFAVHPLRVESVAWITERKDLLYAFFYLLAVISYLRFVSGKASKGVSGQGHGRSRWYYYGAALLFFLMSLLSKAMAVTLPAVLLILDLYPLGRGSQLKRVLLEKAPFFVLSAVFSAITIVVARAEDSLHTLEIFNVPERVLIAAKGYVFYLFKMLAPIRLAPLYPLPKGTEVFTLEFVASFVLFLGVTAICLNLIRRRPELAAAWFYYLVTLLPVSGILQIGGQAAADRFTYLPLLGPFLLLGLLWERYFNSARARGLWVLPVALAVILAGMLSAKTIWQIGIWKDTETLWTHEIEAYPGRVTAAHNNLGTFYKDAGRYDDAMEQFLIAIDVRPSYAQAYYNVGLLYEAYKMPEMASDWYREAIRLEPRFKDTYKNLGALYDRLGDFNSSMGVFREAARRFPDDADTRYNLGVALLQMGMKEEARAEFEAALAIEPTLVEARRMLGSLYDR